MLDQELREYIPGKSIAEVAQEYGLEPKQIIKLGSNENPLGASPKAKEALIEYLTNNSNLGLYPEALGDSLVEALKSKFNNIGKAALVLGNGMDHILECLGRLLLEPNCKTLIHTPTFDYYEMVTRWCKAEPIFVRTISENNFKLDIDKFIEKIDEKTKLVFLCSPNNPTGNILSWEEIKAVLDKAQKFGVKVFLDEAYADFAEKTFIQEVQNFDNLIIGHTFSKIYGLASLRIGWAVLPQDLLGDYRKIQTPFSVNSLGLIAAKAALEDQDFIEKSLKMNIEGIKFLTTELNNLGFKVFSSKANFIAFLANDNNAKALCKRLLNKGVIARNASIFRDAPEGLIRLTVGNYEQNQKVIAALNEL